MLLSSLTLGMCFLNLILAMLAFTLIARPERMVPWARWFLKRKGHAPTPAPEAELLHFLSRMVPFVLTVLFSWSFGTGLLLVLSRGA